MKPFAFLRILLTLGCLTVAAQAADATKIKALIITGGHGFEKEPFFKVFKDNTEIAFTTATQGKSSEAYEREDLFTYDIVILYDMVQTITDTQKERFMKLFERGTGLLVLHHALCSYPDWPDYERIIGGRYLMKEYKEGDAIWPKSDYQHDVDFAVQIVKKDHPIVTGLKDFKIHDEIYKRFRVRPEVTALLTTDHPESGKPLSWAKTQGKSRLVYLQLGHDHSAYQNPNYLEVVRRSIRWVANKPQP
jgi:type 1 glutamine amidotransferase